MSGKLVNRLLVVSVLILLGLLATVVRIRPAEDSVVVLKPTGMTCGGCAAAIEKALQKKRGVAAVEVDLSGGRVIVGYDSKKITSEALVAAVAEGGYESRIDGVMSIRQFRTKTGRDPGGGGAPSGCIWGCGGK